MWRCGWIRLTTVLRQTFALKRTFGFHAKGKFLERVTVSFYAMNLLIRIVFLSCRNVGFDSRWCHWNFSLTSFGRAMALGFDSDSNYQEYFLWIRGGRCVRLTTLPSSCADCLEIWEPQPPGTLRACPGLHRECFTFTCMSYLDGHSSVNCDLNMSGFH